jgi:hypothetical protein
MHNREHFWHLPQTHGGTAGAVKRFGTGSVILFLYKYTSYLKDQDSKLHKANHMTTYSHFSAYILSGAVTSQLGSYSCLRFAVHECTNITQIFSQPGKEKNKLHGNGLPWKVVTPIF